MQSWRTRFRRTPRAVLVFAIRKIEPNALYSETRLIDSENQLNKIADFDNLVEAPVLQLTRSKQIDAEVHDFLKMQSVNRVNTPVITMPTEIKAESK